MNNDPACAEYDNSEPRWREHTFLEYVADTPGKDGRLPIGGVERAIFASDQPEQFTHFADRCADLGLRYLDLNEDRYWQLLHGLATSGVRVPGTGFVMRVVRPWYAFFEKRAGEFPALPHDWMEGVRLQTENAMGEIEWIGRQHSTAREGAFDPRCFDEMPSGWRLKDNPPDPLPNLRLPAEAYSLSVDALREESERVLAELAEFEEHLLPAIAAEDATVASELNPKEAVLGNWTEAINHLRTVLTGLCDAHDRPYFDPRDFNLFLWPGPTPDCAITASRIRWQMSSSDDDWRFACDHASTLPEQCRAISPCDVARSIAATKQWMLCSSVRGGNLRRAMRKMLPIIADRDPEFAAMALDVEGWRERIQIKEALSSRERILEMATLDGQFRSVLHQAITSVIQALANNHFMRIRAYMDHPELHGECLWRVPFGLMAILTAKAEILVDIRHRNRNASPASNAAETEV